MQSNHPQLDNRTKTRIYSVTNQLLQLCSPFLTPHQRLKRWGPTITSRALPSLKMSQRELLHQDLQSNVKTLSGKVLCSEAQQTTFQPENASPRRALATRVCGVMNRSNGKRRSHSLPWWAKNRRLDLPSSTREQLMRERPRSYTVRDTKLVRAL